MNRAAALNSAKGMGFGERCGKNEVIVRPDPSAFETGRQKAGTGFEE
jgi:hypothetical protein